MAKDKIDWDEKNRELIAKAQTFSRENPNEKNPFVEELYIFNKPLIHSFVYKAAPRIKGYPAYTEDDILQEFAMKFSNLVKNFDLTKNVKFSSFIHMTIKNVVDRIYRKENTNGSRVLNESISLQKEIGKEGDGLLQDIIPDPESLEDFENADKRVYLRNFLKKLSVCLTPKKYDIFMQILQNGQAKVAEKYKKSAAAISFLYVQTMNKIKSWGALSKPPESQKNYNIDNAMGMYLYGDRYSPLIFKFLPDSEKVRLMSKEFLSLYAQKKIDKDSLYSHLCRKVFTPKEAQHFSFITENCLPRILCKGIYKKNIDTLEKGILDKLYFLRSYDKTFGILNYHQTEQSGKNANLLHINFNPTALKKQSKPFFESYFKKYEKLKSENVLSLGNFSRTFSLSMLSTLNLKREGLSKLAEKKTSGSAPITDEEWKEANSPQMCKLAIEAINLSPLSKM